MWLRFDILDSAGVSSQFAQLLSVLRQTLEVHPLKELRAVLSSNNDNGCTCRYIICAWCDGIRLSWAVGAYIVQMYVDLAERLEELRMMPYRPLVNICKTIIRRSTREIQTACICMWAIIMLGRRKLFVQVRWKSGSGVSPGRGQMKNLNFYHSKMLSETTFVLWHSIFYQRLGVATKEKLFLF